MSWMLSPSSSWVPRLLAFALVASAAAAPAVAQAQALPKGYASDESPSAPAATAATTPAAAPAATMTPTGSDGTAAATVQISTNTDEYADTDASALTDFQEPLQGYGTWVADDTYGTIWVPDSDLVGEDFAPYQSGGYWTTTDEGEWLWVSTYDWGYVPFHYGRWLWIGGRGWSWIPGRTYAPSWVVWRTSDYGYIGWAPMPPEYYWSGTTVVYFTTTPSAAYVFCPTTYVYNTSVSTYIVHDKGTVTKIAAHSRNYKPASPSAHSVDNKSPDSAGASKSGSGTRTANSVNFKKPVGPSAKEAGIPDSAVPKSRGAHDSRAKAFSKKSTTAKAKTLVKTQRAALASAGKLPAPRGNKHAGNSALSPATIKRSPVAATSTSTSSRPGTVASTSSRPGTVVSRAGTGVSQPQPPPSRGNATVIRTPSARSSGGSSSPQPAVRGHRSSTSVSVPAPPSQPAASAPAAKPRVATPAPAAPRAAAPAPRPAAAPARAATPSAAPRASGGGHHRR